MDLLIIALAPIVIVATYIFYRDKYEREPIGLLLKALLSGAFIVFPILVVERVLSGFLLYLSGLAQPIYHAFIVAASTEEIFKFLALLILFWKSKEFNEKFDGIVYATFISLGFAAVENVLYVIERGYETGLMRAITAVPAHAIFGITMGFYAGLAKFYDKNKKQLLWKSLLVPILMHGIYDFILMAGFDWMLFFFAGFVIYLYFSGLRLMKKLSGQSIYNTDFNLLNKIFKGKE